MSKADCLGGLSLLVGLASLLPARSLHPGKQQASQKQRRRIRLPNHPVIRRILDLESGKQGRPPVGARRGSSSGAEMPVAAAAGVSGRRQRRWRVTESGAPMGLAPSGKVTGKKRTKGIARFGAGHTTCFTREEKNERERTGIHLAVAYHCNLALLHVSLLRGSAK